MPTPSQPSSGMSRRRFLASSARAGLGLGALGLALHLPLAPRAVAQSAGRKVLLEDLRDAAALAAASVPGDQGAVSRVLAASSPFTHVGLHWEGAPDVPVEVQTSQDGQAWTPWRRVVVEARPGDTPRAAETFSALVEAPRHRFVRYRLGSTSAPLGAVTATCLNSLDGPRLDSAPAVGARLGIAEALAGGEDFRTGIITREQWGADESIRFGPNGQETWIRAYVAPRLVTVHHTATDNTYTDAAAVVRAIYAYHTITQGWGDIGYHALIDRDGHIYEGRRGRDVDPYGQLPRDVLSYGVVAGHARGYNYGSAGVALIGNFQEAEPSEAMLQRLEDLLLYLLGRYQIDPRGTLDFARSSRLWRYDLPALPGHRDCNVTECPGDHVYARLGELRQRLAVRLGGGEDSATAITEAPAGRNLWPGATTVASYTWSGRAPFDCVYEGFYQAPGQDPADNLLGYDALAMPQHIVTPQRGVAFKLQRPGQYTLHLRPNDRPFADRHTVMVEPAVVVDDADPGAERDGDWTRSAEVHEFYGSGYKLAPAGSEDRFRWTLAPPEAGRYSVQACWASGTDRSKTATYRFGVAGASSQTATVDQTTRGETWVELGTLDLAAGQSCQVELVAAKDGSVVADAVRLLRLAG